MPLMGPSLQYPGEGPEVWSVQYKDASDIMVAVDKINATGRLRAEVADSVPNEPLRIELELTDDVSINFRPGDLLVMFAGSTWHFQYDEDTREPVMSRTVIYA